MKYRSLISIKITLTTMMVIQIVNQFTIMIVLSNKYVQSVIMVNAQNFIMNLPLTIIEIYQYVEMDQSKNKKQNAIVQQNLILIIDKLTINFFLVKVIIYIRLVDYNEKIVFVKINWISQVIRINS
ncbi:unnamed protein product [Paramecium primaurelia]|uniref:Transmembrane protein n=1 Tax=Paramecium primaurelia TaxID=5886 RepID=A0A8S1QTX0_PARPR|nr:unnamed protein product [Paramecium primaurelia]